jgi:hypothetical protein
MLYPRTKNSRVSHAAAAGNICASRGIRSHPSRSMRRVGSLWGPIPAPIAGCPTSRSFFARCGIPQGSPSSLLWTPQLRRGAPGCSHQRTWAENDGRPQISYVALLARATCAALLKESRMKSINATGLHRKSGGEALHRFSLRTLPPSRATVRYSYRSRAPRSYRPTGLL